MRKTVFFDIGNVLLFFSHEKMCHNLAELLELPFEGIWNTFFEKRHFALEFEKGNLSVNHLFRMLLPPHRQAEPLDLHALLFAVANIFQPNQEIFPIVEKLKGKGVQLILLSNTSEPHFNFAYSSYPVFQLFDDKVLSYEENLIKPDKKIFYKALQKAQTPSSECFYIDDLKENILSARRLGIFSHQYKDIPSLEKALIAKNFL